MWLITLVNTFLPGPTPPPVPNPQAPASASSQRGGDAQRSGHAGLTAHHSGPASQRRVLVTLTPASRLGESPGVAATLACPLRDTVTTIAAALLSDCAAAAAAAALLRCESKSLARGLLFALQATSLPLVKIPSVVETPHRGHAGILIPRSGRPGPRRSRAALRLPRRR